MTLLPRGLTGRTILVLLAAVSLVHFGSMLIYERGVVRSIAPLHEADARQRLEAARAVLSRQPVAERPITAALLSSGNFQLTWTASEREHNHPINAGIGLHADILESTGAIHLDDGTAVHYRLLSDPHEGHAAHATLLSTSVMVLGVIFVAALLVRGIVAPLRRLARAADAIGYTVDQPPVPEEGPNEVQQVARAFNAMQRRIARLIADRTQALAAVSHDLRTPITRLRLRAGFMPDRETQASVDRDLDEMENMIGTTLAFLSGDQDSEARRPIDLPALLETLVDAEVDQDHLASYEGPAHLTVFVRPLSLKRAFANLIANAIAYGGAARVRLRSTRTGPVVTIDDDGPGIPEDDIGRVFEPFVRLEYSRNRATGGVGLGLTIAQRAVLAEGGVLSLRNRVGGGLTACVELPPGQMAGRIPDRRSMDAHVDPTPHGDRGNGELADAGARRQDIESL